MVDSSAPPMNALPSRYGGGRIDPAGVTTANRTLAEPCAISAARPHDRMGTMIRHTTSNLAKPIISLAYPVRFSASIGPLVPEMGCTVLLPSGCLATCWAAIALAPVAMATDAEDGGAGTTAALTKNDLGHDGFLLPGNHTTPGHWMMCAWQRR